MPGARGQQGQVPQGTLKGGWHLGLGRPFGTCSAATGFPALKRRAILEESLRDCVPLLWSVERKRRCARLRSVARCWLAPRRNFCQQWPHAIMSQSKYLTAPIKTDKMPPGVPFIVGNEAAERFSYYGMNSILVPFMTHYILNAA